ncbi:MAG: PhoH family protein [Opitutales bacterium]
MAEKTITFQTSRFLSELYCNKQENLDLAQDKLNVSLSTRDDWLKIEADDESNIELCSRFFAVLALGKKQGLSVNDSDFRSMLEKAISGRMADLEDLFKNPLVINLKKRSIVPKNINQKRYIQNIEKNDVVIGVGPAGTGKTYLAVACALKYLQEKKIAKIILTRPAVEAGEALGFLPGDLQEKLDPYLRPLYDAMYDMLGSEETARLMERQVIEIAPLAYMRGRTLANAYIILDEAQNTTMEQMLMFLTRLGENSRMIVTGDITQIDLPKNKKSGLKGATETLNNIKGIEVFKFEGTDVVRHPLVTKIIQAYEAKGKDLWQRND